MTTETWSNPQKGTLVHLAISVRTHTVCATRERGWQALRLVSRKHQQTGFGFFSVSRLPSSCKWIILILPHFPSYFHLKFSSYFLPPISLKVVGEKWISETMETELLEPFEWDGIPTDSFLVGFSSMFHTAKKDRQFVFYTTRFSENFTQLFQWNSFFLAFADLNIGNSPNARTGVNLMMKTKQRVCLSLQMKRCQKMIYLIRPSKNIKEY